MAKPKKKRLVRFEPEVSYFKPRGVPISELKEVNLTLDELEAIRLTDFENSDQTEAAEKMGISQSTIHRILAAAHRKVAEALIKGYAIKMEGGDYKMVFGRGLGIGRGRGVGRGGGRGRMGGPLAAGPGGACVCPSCGHEVTHQVGAPCTGLKCEECGTIMVRKS